MDYLKKYDGFKMKKSEVTSGLFRYLSDVTFIYALQIIRLQK